MKKYSSASAFQARALGNGNQLKPTSVPPHAPHAAGGYTALAYTPAEPPWSLQARIAKLFQTTVEIVNLPDGRSYGSFLDTVRKVRSFDDPALVVQCGSETGLAAIVIGGDNLALLDPLFSLNPWMIHTLKTMWHAQLFLWVRLDGHCPPSYEVIDGCRWLSQTLVPVNDLRGDQYQSVSFPFHGTKIQTVRFNQFNWPTKHC